MPAATLGAFLIAWGDWENTMSIYSEIRWKMHWELFGAFYCTISVDITPPKCWHQQQQHIGDVNDIRRLLKLSRDVRWADEGSTIFSPLLWYMSKFDESDIAFFLRYAMRIFPNCSHITSATWASSINSLLLSPVAASQHGASLTHFTDFAL